MNGFLKRGHNTQFLLYPRPLSWWIFMIFCLPTDPHCLRKSEGSMSHPAPMAAPLLALLTLNICSLFTIGSCWLAKSHSTQTSQWPTLVGLRYIRSVYRNFPPQPPMFVIFVNYSLLTMVSVAAGYCRPVVWSPEPTFCPSQAITLPGRIMYIARWPRTACSVPRRQAYS